jgi:hypothetical protein
MPRSPTRYSTDFSSAATIPAGTDIDSLFLDGDDAGDLIFGFDAPATIGEATYDPADLVRYAGTTFSLFFDASAAGVPPTSNVVGADVRDGKTILTFDVPTTLGATTYFPGELVAWNGSSFSSFYVDSMWPPSAVANALGLLVDPGSVAIEDLAAGDLQQTKVLVDQAAGDILNAMVEIAEATLSD